MSSATSTKPAAAPVTPSRRVRVPWLLVLPAALAVATAIYLFGLVGAAPSGGTVFLVIGAAAFGAVGVQIGRAIVAAVAAAPSAETLKVSSDRHRRELEREKAMILKAIKELEFDHQMGKISAADYTEAHATYRARAVRVLEQLDAGAGGYREIIERELEERLSAPAKVPPTAPAPAAPEPEATLCACGARNDADAVFCKKCGARLHAEATP